MTDIDYLIERLGDEADLCRNETATDIADLLDETVKLLTAHRESLREIYQAATGEKQVGRDDTDGLAWIADRLKPLVQSAPPSAAQEGK